MSLIKYTMSNYEENEQGRLCHPPNKSYKTLQQKHRSREYKRKLINLTYLDLLLHTKQVEIGFSGASMLQIVQFPIVSVWRICSAVVNLIPNALFVFGFFSRIFLFFWFLSTMSIKLHSCFLLKTLFPSYVLFTCLYTFTSQCYKTSQQF